MCMRCADLRSSLSFEVATVDCCAKAGIARSRARTREKSFAGRDILHLQVRKEISVESNNVRGLTKIQQGYTDTRRFSHINSREKQSALGPEAVRHRAGLISFWRETKDPGRGPAGQPRARALGFKVQIAESPERAAQGVRSQLQINARHKAPLWYRDQLHRPFGASVVTVLVPRACALGFPESPLRG